MTELLYGDPIEMKRLSEAFLLYASELSRVLSRYADAASWRVQKRPKRPRPRSASWFSSAQEAECQQANRPASHRGRRGVAVG